MLKIFLPFLLPTLTSLCQRSNISNWAMSLQIHGNSPCSYWVPTTYTGLQTLCTGTPLSHQLGYEISLRVTIIFPCSWHGHQTIFGLNCSRSKGRERGITEKVIYYFKCLYQKKDKHKIKELTFYHKENFLKKNNKLEEWKYLKICGH